MSILADTHVHIYPCHDPLLTFSCAMKNLGKAILPEHSPSPSYALCLTERFDCNYFQELKSSGHLAGEGMRLLSCHDHHIVIEVDTRELYLFAGRQIVSAERVEVLSLLSDQRIDDGMPLSELITAVHNVGGLPVLSWAPGKWLGKRGELVKRELQRAQPGMLLAGDSSLRPPVWGTPKPMTLAMRRGLGVIAGSDPLPFEGEERQCGAYASLLEGEIRAETALADMRAALINGATRQIGRRNGLVSVLKRLKQNQAVRTSPVV
jgi:hypothetical protein